MSMGDWMSRLMNHLRSRRTAARRADAISRALRRGQDGTGAAPDSDVSAAPVHPSN
jgi:hypothetical protein